MIQAFADCVKAFTFILDAARLNQPTDGPDPFNLNLYAPGFMQKKPQPTADNALDACLNSLLASANASPNGGALYFKDRDELAAFLRSRDEAIEIADAYKQQQRTDGVRFGFNYETGRDHDHEERRGIFPLGSHSVNLGTYPGGPVRAYQCPACLFHFSTPGAKHPCPPRVGKYLDPEFSTLYPDESISLGEARGVEADGREISFDYNQGTPETVCAADKLEAYRQAIEEIETAVARSGCQCETCLRRMGNPLRYEGGPLL